MLLDTTWRVAQTETARTDALDRKAATAASFASVLATLTATLGISFVERVDAWWTLLLFLLGLLAFLGAVATAVVALFPWEVRGDSVELRLLGVGLSLVATEAATLATMEALG